jgi:hypothetical protein
MTEFAMIDPLIDFQFDLPIDLSIDWPIDLLVDQPIDPVDLERSLLSSGAY